MKIFLLFLFLPITLLSETVVSGIITQNEWWSRDKSPYIVTNDLVIGPDARLVIEPGVEVLIEKPTKIPANIEQRSSADTFSVSINIYGAFRCVGKPDLPIIFKARYLNKSDEYTHWEGIRVSSSRSNEIFINYTHVLNAATGITIEQGTPLLRNNLFRKNSVGLKCINSSSPRIVNSLFTDNFLCGLRIQKANPEVYNSIFYLNRNIAVWGDNVSKLSFEYNGLFKNGDRDFVDCNPELGIISATNKNGDSTDTYGNIFLDPLFVGSGAEKVKKDELKKALFDKSIKKPSSADIQKIEETPFLSEGRTFFLSQFSPYVNAGHPSDKFEEADRSLPDLGIWGGPEYLEF